MKKSIETIWKEGFLNEESLIGPKINNLYNIKSTHMVTKLIRLFKINTFILVVFAILILIIQTLLGAFWEGLAAAFLLLATAWYNALQMKQINTLEQGTSSYQYLKSFDLWLKNTLSKTAKVLRFTYPLYFLIAMSTIWTVWKSQAALENTLQKYFPNSTFFGGIPLILLIGVGTVVLLMIYFSDKIYEWDVRIIYGRFFDKLQDTISEMEELRKGNETITY